MLCTASIRAVDAHGGVVIERILPSQHIDDVQAELSEFADLLERRNVRFERIVFDITPTVIQPVQRPIRGGYIGLFPELFDSSKIAA